MNPRLSPLLIAFLIGAPGIVLLRILEGAEHRGLATLWAVAVIIVLGFYHYKQYRDGGANIEQAADELYYLGLLFTLISLIYALVTLFGLKDATSSLNLSERTDELIGSFGVALISTVVGILGRVILLSMKDSAAGQQLESAQGASDGTSSSVSGDMVDVNLAMLARRLRAEMRDAADAFSHYSRMTTLQAESTREYAKQTAKEFSKELEIIAKDFVIQSENTHREISKHAQEAIDTIKKQLADMTAPLATFTEKLDSLNTMFAKACESFEQLRQNTDGLDESSKLVAEKMADVLRQMKTLEDNISNYQGVMAQNLEKAKDSSEKFFLGLERTQHNMQTLGATTSDVEGKLGNHAGRFSEHVRNLSESVKQHQEAMEQDRRTTTMMSEQVHEEMTKLTQLIKQIEENLKNAGR